MTFFDVQQLLKKHGTIIYTGNRTGDLELMEDELKELHQLGLLENDMYRDARLVLMKEKDTEKIRKL